MTPLPSPGAVLRVEFLTNDDASILSGSRFYLSYTGGPPNTTDLNALALIVADGWGTEIAPGVNANEFLSSVVIRDLSSDTGAVGQWNGTKQGSLGDQRLPSSAAALVNHKIGRAYRGGKPRTYLRCGSSTSLQGSNEWTSAFIASIIAAWSAWIAGILATNTLSITLTNIVNVSYYSGFTVHTTPSGRAKNIPTKRATPVIDNITSSAIALKVGSQRRRLNI